MSNVPPGWYPDPTNPLQERLWDGSAWTDQARPKSPASMTSPSSYIHGSSINAADQPKSYLGLSIASTVCGCLPLGIWAIVLATQVDNAWRNGDTALALKNSASAKKISFISLGIGATLFVFQIALAAFSASM